MVPLEEGLWYYSEGDKQIGPLSAAQLLECAQSGQMTRSALVWREGLPDWIKAKEVAGLLSEVQSGAPALDHSRGLWRDGDILVVKKGAPFPPRCVKTNQPTSFFLKRELHYNSPWVYLTVFLGLLILVIVALVTRKSATLHVGLSEEYNRERKRAILTAWMIALSGIGLFVAGIGYEQAVALSVGIFAFVGAIIYGTIKGRVISAKKIDDQFAWVKGVCPEFLDQLPEWRGVIR